MNTEQEILSKYIIFTKYARHLDDKNRRETWEELVDRNVQMHKKKYKDKQVHEIIDKAYQFVYDKKVLPSMRSLQFGGKPIEITPSRIYNCAFLPIDSVDAFNEIMFLLLGGTGVGYSVQQHHVRKLPPIKKPLKKRRYLIGDSIEGWADSVKALMRAYLDPTKRTIPEFDYSDIRPKGARLVTSGGKAPGPEPLKRCLQTIELILERKQIGEQLTTIEVHDIVCHIADAVLAGGIRRAALISLFSIDDIDMLTAKSGNWWELNPQRGRANNSVVIIRSRVSEKKFKEVWEFIKNSGAGEPGVYFSNDKEWGTNPSLSGGTKVLTKDGIFPIEELENKTFKVRNLNGQWSNAKCWLSGRDKQLYEITLKGGKKYYCTPEHEWAIKTKDGWVKKQTPEIKIGDRFPVNKNTELFDGKLGNEKDGFFIGWHLGDGWTTSRKEGYLQHGLIVSKKEKEIKPILKNYLKEILNINCNFSDRGTTYELNTASKEWNHLQETFDYSTKERGLPLTTWSKTSESFRKGLINGLFSSDGHVENRKRGRITFTTKHYKLAQDVSDLLGFYGVKNSLKKSKTKKGFVRFDVRITGQNNIRHFRNLFKLSCTHKQERLDLYNWKQKPRIDDHIEVDNIKLTDIKEDVWDISVKDDTHCFQIEQCITGNCAEIALKPFQFCNLTEINAATVESQEDFEERVWAATVIGTLQAGYTDFHYLRSEWIDTTEKDALIGVGITGIASNKLKDIDIKKGAKYAKEVNERVAELIGINKASRVTTVKPSGTSSLVLGCSSGIHAYHNDYYIRGIQLNKTESIYGYLKTYHPELIEEYQAITNTGFFRVPLKAPDGSAVRTESTKDLLDRVKRYNLEWVRGGHRKGMNANNVSATISVKDDEWDMVGNWMWRNKNTFNGLSVLPHHGGTYTQSPFQDCTEEEYEEMKENLNSIDLTNVREDEDYTDLKGEAACAGGACEIV